MDKNPLHTLAGFMTGKFIEAAPQQAAEALSSRATHEVLLLVSSQKAQTLIAVLNVMEPAKAAAVLRRIAFKQAAYVFSHLEVVQAAKLWKEFATPYQERLKEVLAPAFVELLTQAGGFAANSVGRVMQTDFMAVRTETKITDLVARLKNLPRKKLPAACFVTGKNGELKGSISTVELVFLNPQAVCGSVMNKNVCGVKPQDSLVAAQALFDKEETALLPVVNEKNILVGALAKEHAFTASPAKKTLWFRLKNK